MAMKGPIEAKVTASVLTGAVTTFVLWVVSHYLFDDNIPDAVSGLIAAGIPALAIFVAGYFTKHTPRPDLGEPPATLE